MNDLDLKQTQFRLPAPALLIALTAIIYIGSAWTPSLQDDADAAHAEAARGEGLLVVAPRLEMMQLRTRRPVLTDPNAIDMIAYVPQGRRVWPSLSVDETLKLVARNRREVDRVYTMFPRLAERRGQAKSRLFECPAELECHDHEQDSEDQRIGAEHRQRFGINRRKGREQHQSETDEGRPLGDRDPVTQEIEQHARAIKAEQPDEPCQIVHETMLADWVTDDRCGNHCSKPSDGDQLQSQLSEREHDRPNDVAGNFILQRPKAAVERIGLRMAVKNAGQRWIQLKEYGVPHETPRFAAAEEFR